MKKELENDRLLRALLRDPVDRTPVWMMRQAGRYLPEYRATRERAGSFVTLMQTPELACEVTLQPLERFELDAAILFSDILTIPDAMGLGLEVVGGEGPRFANPLSASSTIDRLAPPDPEADLGYVMDAIRLIRRELNGRVPLIGFAGSPWTLATYMIEGRGSKQFPRTKALLYDDPARLHRLLEVLANAVTIYLNAQIAAGAQAVMIFDSWGGALTTPGYQAFSLDYMQRICDNLTREAEGRTVPRIIFTKGGGQWLDAMAGAGADAVGLDWTCELGLARESIGARVALQGNMDPAALNATPASIRAEVARILESYGQGSGHVFNLGHGITPDVLPEHAGAMVDAVRELSPAYHC
jgi:uroporphyrinogen decarboxylase